MHPHFSSFTLLSPVHLPCPRKAQEDSSHSPAQAFLHLSNVAVEAAPGEVMRLLHSNGFFSVDTDGIIIARGDPARQPGNVSCDVFVRMNSKDEAQMAERLDGVRFLGTRIEVHAASAAKVMAYINGAAGAAQ